MTDGARPIGIVDAWQRPDGSGGVLAQIVDAPRQVADEPEEHVHRRGLDVSARLPEGDRVGAETEQPCHLALRQREALPNVYCLRPANMTTSQRRRSGVQFWRLRDGCNASSFGSFR